MKEGQKFKLIKWNKQLISVATGILLVSQLAVGPVQVLAETTDSASPSSSENINPENQLDVGMSGELFTAENQNSNGNTGGESQASTDRATTRNNLSPQNDTITTQADLQDVIDKIEGSGTIILSNNIDISAKTIDISGKNITLTSTDDATLKRVTNYFGGVFNVINSGGLTLNGVSVDGNIDNKGTAGSSLITLNGATFTLESGTIKNGNSSNNGGAINSPYGSNNTINISGGTISDNLATAGGGIFSDRGTVTVSGGTISDNTATRAGGGIYSERGTVTVSGNGTISDNTATSNGGGIYASNASVTVSGNGTVNDNTATLWGGGIYALKEGTVRVSGNGTISDNTAAYGGGINASIVTVIGGIISDNTATDGGGIYSADPDMESKINIEGGTISNNTATNRGSGIYNSLGTVTMTDGLIYGVADAALDLVHNGGTWSGPTGAGVAIAKSTSSSSLYEWGTNTDLDGKFGGDIQKQKPYWTIKEDAVGIGYLMADGSESFLPITDAKIKLTGDLLDNTDKTYTGAEQKISPSINHADFITAFDNEVTFEYQASGSGEKTDTMTNVGTYKVFAKVTGEKSKLFSVVELETSVTVNKAVPTIDHFDLDKVQQNLIYKGEPLTVDITSKDQSLQDFEVTYIETSDQGHTEYSNMTKTGTYRIRISVSNNNPNFTSHGFNVENLLITVRKEPQANMYKTDMKKSYIYNSEQPKISITESDPDLVNPKVVIEPVAPLGTTNGVGTYKVYITNDQSETYAAGKVAIGEFSIEKATLTAKAENAVINQRDPLPSAKISYSGFYGEDNQRNVFATQPTATFKDVTDSKTAGEFDILVSGGELNDTNGKNYRLEQKNGVLKINEKAYLPFPEDDLIYHLPEQFEYTGEAQGLTEDPTILNYDEAKFGQLSVSYTQKNAKARLTGAPVNAGDYQVIISTTGGTDYAAYTKTIDFTIAKKAVTAKVDNVTVTQGDILPEATISNYVGFVGEENENNIFSTPPKATYSVETSEKAGEFEIEVTAKNVGEQFTENYKITYQKGTLTVTEKPEEDRAPLYRVYNPNNGEHLYTKSLIEAQGLVNKGWQDEGIGWYGAEKSGKPVYRLYNRNSGEHFYTLDKGEYDNVANAGWVKEDISFYAAEDTEIPIYRVFNPNSKDAGSHHYTLSTDENTWLIQEGWKSEGIGFYGK